MNTTQTGKKQYTPSFTSMDQKFSHQEVIQGKMEK